MMAPTIPTSVIDDLPEDFALLANDGKKRPISAVTGRWLEGWQSSGGESRELLKRSSYVKAIGVICGSASGGVLVIDIDGERGPASFAKLTGHQLEDLPKSLACSSGKPHRHKIFLSVPDRDVHGFITGIGSGSAEYPDLEILWDGRQAVIVGEHPDMVNGYFFLDGCGLDVFDKPAEAPDWLIDALVCAPATEAASLPPSADLETIAVLLSHLNPDDFGDYEPWRNLGMALKLADASDDCLRLWDNFSRKAPKYDEKVLERQWRSFKTMEQFKAKFPNKRPITIASFIRQAKDNGFRPPAQSVTEERATGDALKNVRERPTIINLIAFLRECCDVRWNELKRHVVFDGEPLDPKMARAMLADQYGIEADRSKAEEAVELVAKESPFNPVRDYLNGLRSRDLPLVSDDELADCFGFAANDDVSIGLMRVHLRACVNRGLNPGSKMDSLLIIQGEQGHFKSTSIEALAPDIDWYDESTRFAIDSRDALSSFNSAWLYEFSEVEKLLSTNDVATLKSWITRKIDRYVEKYEKISVSHPRRCCLFGTTNSSAFLIDPTGARRFWVCQNIKPANIALLKRLRDAIWHQSLIELEGGLPYFLNNGDRLFASSQQRAHDATISDPWEDRLASNLKDARADDFVTSNQLMIYLEKKIDKCHAGDYRRLSNIMARLNWAKTRRRQGVGNPVDGYYYLGPKNADQNLDNIF